MRDIPADLQLEPMPADFTCNIAQDDTRGVMKATVTIEGHRYEIGIRDMGTADAVAYLKESVWQLQELVRVGREDLCAYARADRHMRR